MIGIGRIYCLLFEFVEVEKVGERVMCIGDFCVVNIGIIVVGVFGIYFYCCVIVSVLGIVLGFLVELFYVMFGVGGCGFWKNVGGCMGCGDDY